MGKKHYLISQRLAALAASYLLLASCAVNSDGDADSTRAAARTENTEVQGAADYMEFCASCHGRQGRGDGAVSQFLTKKAPDLTLLSLVNGGKYPKNRVRYIIDGRLELLMHGSRTMPVWGNAFRKMEGEKPKPYLQPQNKDVVARIDDLVAYIGSIQE